MNLQPSLSISFNEKRELFAHEMRFGGHGQVYVNGSGTVYPQTGYVFHRVYFLTDSNVVSAGFRNLNDSNDSIYMADNFLDVDFPAGFTWHAPLTSLSLGGGSAIAYQYRKFIIEDLFCVSNCNSPSIPDDEEPVVGPGLLDSILSPDSSQYLTSPDGTQYLAQPE